MPALRVLNGVITGSGPVRVWMHGVLSSSHEFKYFAKKVGGTQVVLDARNHGKSFAHPSMTKDEMARDVINFLDNHRIDRASLIGFSMGAHTALQAACSYPDRIEKLVLLDILPLPFRKAYPEIATQMESLLKFLGTVPLNKGKDYVIGMLNAVLKDPYLQLMIRNLKETEDGVQWRVPLKCLSQAYSIGDNADNTLKGSFSGPSLVLLAGESDMSMRKVAELGQPKDLFADFLTDFRIEVVEGAGHTLHLQYPRTVTKLISDFLN